MQSRFLLGNEAQEKHLNFVPNSMVKVLEAASRVQMNAPKYGLPLTPLPTLGILLRFSQIFPLTDTDAVIHGATLSVESLTLVGSL
jgi:hypothetical protein